MNESQKDVEVTVSLREILQVREVLEEFVGFLHQPLHYETPGQIIAFLEGGAYQRLSDAYDKITDNWLPEKQKQDIENL